MPMSSCAILLMLLINKTQKKFTSWFDVDARVPLPLVSVPNISAGFEVPGKDGIDITSPAVWVEGVEGAELGEGPAVLAVPELLAGPEEDIGCFLFLPFWFLEALISWKYVSDSYNYMENNRSLVNR